MSVYPIAHNCNQTEGRKYKLWKECGNRKKKHRTFNENKIPQSLSIGQPSALKYIAFYYIIYAQNDVIAFR